MSRFFRPVLAITAATALVAGAGATAASGAGKAAVLASWTQTGAGSYKAWNAARQDQRAWASFGFDWSTDYCSVSPDRPLGFDFRLSCHRHDFGYRNYRAVGGFDEAKSRIDKAFHADLLRVCDTSEAAVRPACDSLADTYYEAVVIFGSTEAVSQADLDRAARIKADALAASDAAAAAQ